MDYTEKICVNLWNLWQKISFLLFFVPLCVLRVKQLLHQFPHNLHTWTCKNISGMGRICELSA